MDLNCYYYISTAFLQCWAEIILCSLLYEDTVRSHFPIFYYVSGDMLLVLTNIRAKMMCDTSSPRYIRVSVPCLHSLSCFNTGCKPVGDSKASQDGGATERKELKGSLIITWSKASTPHYVVNQDKSLL